MVGGAPAGQQRKGEDGPGLPPCRVSGGGLRVYTEAPASLEETFSAGCLGSRSHSLFLPLQDQGVNSLAIANP